MTTGRPRQFDEATVLATVTRTFWDNGYHATSIADIVEATGVHRNSLYATYGDKHQLFTAALKAYIDEAGQRFRDKLQHADSPYAGLRDALLHYSYVSATASGPRGCLVTNTTIELRREDKDLTAQIRAGMKQITDMLRAAVEHGQAIGEISPEIDPADAALFLYSFGQGLRVTGRIARLADLERTVDLALRALYLQGSPGSDRRIGSGSA
ncbi:TetR/AcrR family transcriptional regulator [Bradyrhizobium sp. CIAT3101]|uniref:TetR/AcrR family transcriptional regulator n=1 Tax=Bradyrhizobium sp. CIAT3101 TaxID=439387 RepID=UPI0024B0B38D|nr:TetR/AcrR family transcriptional regulator [Bradyrhizobium sp. CIAT3101]WFU78144.1 TetR/AcrR family transcriptional regulator [Bradyrhizobium sp. CIAT3101]